MDKTSITNDIAVITPYEVTFRCFSTELGAMLSGYASSPHALVVRGINVEPAGTGAGPGGEMGLPEMYTPTYRPVPVAPLDRRRMNPEAEFARRYAPPVRYAPAPTTSRGGLKTLLDEKQLKVTLLIEVVKLTLKD